MNKLFLFNKNRHIEPMELEEFRKCIHNYIIALFGVLGLFFLLQHMGVDTLHLLIGLLSIQVLRMFVPVTNNSNWYRRRSKKLYPKNEPSILFLICFVLVPIFEIGGMLYLYLTPDRPNSKVPFFLNYQKLTIGLMLSVYGLFGLSSFYFYDGAGKYTNFIAAPSMNYIAEIYSSANAKEYRLPEEELKKFVREDQRKVNNIGFLLLMSAHADALQKSQKERPKGQAIDSKILLAFTETHVKILHKQKFFALAVKNPFLLLSPTAFTEVLLLSLIDFKTSEMMNEKMVELTDKMIANLEKQNVKSPEALEKIQKMKEELKTTPAYRAIASLPR